ncbi:unnamed protein product, partial [Sphacelaria rigidula]
GRGGGGNGAKKPRRSRHGRGRGGGSGGGPDGGGGQSGGGGGRGRGYNGGAPRPPQHNNGSTARGFEHSDSAQNGMDFAAQPPAPPRHQGPGGDGGGGSGSGGKVNPNSRTSSTTMSQMTQNSFAELSLCGATQRAISEVLRYETMTKVQVHAIPPALAGHDVLAKAKTGTGKTLSFLLPAIEGVARTPRHQRGGISVVIISPTRELAQQIADEAAQVL